MLDGQQNRLIFAMLHLFGIDYNRFSYKFQGLDARLTGVEHPTVVKEILG